MPKQPLSRIMALDLFRGYLLCVIAIDHLYRFPSLLDTFTGQGKLWVSAAEGFFIISGLLVGRLKQSPQKLWARALKLYLLSIALTLVFTWWGSIFGNHPLKSGIWTGPPDSLIVDLVSLKYVYGWADFLPYYVIFLLFSPLALLALKRNRPWLVLIVSALFWLIRGNQPYLAWQVLYFSGLVVGFYLSRVEKLFSRFLPVIIFLALTSIIISAHTVFVRQLTNPFFDKVTVAPGRLILAWIWFTAGYLFIRRFESPLNRLTGGFFRLLGRHSLFVYILQAILLFPLTSILPPRPDYWLNSLYAFSLLLLIFFSTYFKTRLQFFPRKFQSPA